MLIIKKHQQAAGIALTCLGLLTSPTSFAADNILTMKLEKTTNDHSLTLPKIAYTRVFEDTSALTLEKSWYWQEGFHEDGWPKHDEFFTNYSFPSYHFGENKKWSLTPQIGAKFRSNVTRALAAIKVGYQGEGWGLATRYRYEHETTNKTSEEGQAGRVDIYASYSINESWKLLYNPHYHFKQESSSPDFGTGDRDYLEQEFLVFNKIDQNNTLFGGYIKRDVNSDEAATDPGQRNSSWLIGYIYNF